MKQVLLFLVLISLFSCNSIKQNYGFKLAKKSSYKPIEAKVIYGKEEVLVFQKVEESTESFSQDDLVLHADTSTLASVQAIQISPQQELLFTFENKNEVEDTLSQVEIEEQAKQTDAMAAKSKRIGIIALALIASNLPLYFILVSIGVFIFPLILVLSLIATIILSSIGLRLAKRVKKATYITEKGIKDIKKGKFFSLLALISSLILLALFILIVVLLILSFG